MLSSNHVTVVSLVKEQNKHYLNVFAVKELSLQLSLRYLQSFSRDPNGRCLELGYAVSQLTSICVIACIFD